MSIEKPPENTMHYIVNNGYRLTLALIKRWLEKNYSFFLMMTFLVVILSLLSILTKYIPLSRPFKLMLVVPSSIAALKTFCPVILTNVICCTWLLTSILSTSVAGFGYTEIGIPSSSSISPLVYSTIALIRYE